MREATPPASALWRRIATKAQIRLSIIGGTALFLAWLDPFRGGADPFGARLLYWLAIMVYGHLCAEIVMWLITRTRPARPPTGWMYVLGALVAAAPITLGVMALEGLVWSQNAPRYFVVLYPNVLGICAAVFGISWLASRDERASVPPAASPPDPAAAPSWRDAGFAKRLPARLREAELLALAAEDHYVRVITDAGEELVLMRLADAVEELDGSDGAQTHRSWWVARHAVRSAARGNGKATLTLTNGATAPVSRRYAPDLRQAGWFDAE